MKCVLIIISVVFALSQAEGPSKEMIELGEKIDKNFQKCVDKNKVTPAQFENLKKLQLPLDKNLQCTIACLAKELEIMKNDNTLDKTKIATMLKPIFDDLKEAKQDEISKKINEVIDTCLPLQKGDSDECVAANKAAECVIENGKKNGLLTAFL